MNSCFFKWLPYIAKDHIHTDILTCNIRNHNRSNVLEWSVIDYWATGLNSFTGLNPFLSSASAWFKTFGPSCLKLTTLLVNVSLKFQTLVLN